MPRLPQIGADDGNWGQILNDFLSVEHNGDGTLKKTSVIAQASANASTALTSVNGKYTKAPNGIPRVDLSSGVQDTLNTADTIASTVVSLSTDVANLQAAATSGVTKGYVDQQDAQVATDASNALNAHTTNKSNPHEVTKAQIGLGNVPNTDFTADISANTAKISYTDAAKVAGIEVGAQVNAVLTVAGQVGNVSLEKSDVGLNNVDNTADADKPISTAVQAALNAKVNAVASVAGKTGVVLLTKQDVDLDQVDNTSDANKDISTATQSALDNKVTSVIAGANITVDTTDPNNPVISSSGGSGTGSGIDWTLVAMMAGM